jgi:hypothetical protein
MGIMGQAAEEILRPKRDEITEGWRKLNNGKFNNVYISPDVIMLIKSMRMNLTVGTGAIINGY